MFNNFPFKKAFSVTLCLFIILTLFSCMPFSNYAAASVSDYTFTQKFINPMSFYTSTLQDRNNLIKGNRLDSCYVFNEGNTYPVTYLVKENIDGVNTVVTDKYPNFTALTDGTCNNSAEIKCDPTSKGLFCEILQGANQVIDDESRLYYQFNYKLDAKANITGLSLIGHTGQALTPSHFKISIADRAEDLFKNTETAVTYEFRSTGNINEIAFKTAKSGSYVGFRIICGVNLDASSVENYNKNALYLRLAEFCVYGNYQQEYVGSLIPNSQIEPLDNQQVNPPPVTIEYSGNPDKEGRYARNTSAIVKAKANLRYNGKLYSFLRWINTMSGALLSEELSLEIPELCSNITAVYGYSKKAVTYTFVDKNGNTLHEAKIAYGTYVSREDYEKANAKVPELVGYTKAKELITVGSLTANLQVWNADIYNTPAIEDTTFTPTYTPSSNKYTVTVDGNPQSCPFDTKITLASGSGWKVNDVDWQSSSSSDDYTYTVGDMDITKAQTISNVISLYNPNGKSSPTLQNGNITAFAKLNLPSGASLVDCGVLYMGNSYLTDEDYIYGIYNKLSISSAEQIITAKNPRGKHFSATLYSVGRKRTRIARAYVKYVDNSGTHIKYSNVIRISTN